jgi:hypothetical protein
MRIPFAVALSACLAAQPVLASPASPPATSVARASDGSQDQTIGTATGEKVICRSDKEIGSRVKSKRVCMTSKQWAEKAAEERQFVEQRQAQRTISDNN